MRIREVEEGAQGISLANNALWPVSSRCFPFVGKSLARRCLFCENNPIVRHAGLSVALLYAFHSRYIAQQFNLLQ